MRTLPLDTPLVAACRAHLEALPGVRRIGPLRVATRAGADLTVELQTEVGPLQYLAEIKRPLTAPRLEHLLLTTSAARAQRAPRRLLLTDYVAPALAQRLAETDIDFVDAAGNLLIRKPDRLYLFRSGMKPPRTPDRIPPGLSTRSGLQILFVLLVDPQAGALPYRELAQRSGVALGSVAATLAAFRAVGSLVRHRAGWRLVRRRALLELWVSGYGERLRPRLVLGRFQPPERDVAETLARVIEGARRRQIEYAVTGGLAADRLTHHYRGDQLVLHVSAWPPELLQELRWLPSPRGPVTLLRYFGPAVAAPPAGPKPVVLAQPLLVYAELLRDGSERAREAARLVFEQFLAPLAGDDAS